jgi:methionine-rich copper-binding protein CopC
MHFNSTGTVLITIDKGNNLREFSLSTAYDITSAAATGTTNSVASQNPSAAGIDFSSDGKTMYITGTSGVCKVYQYNVTNAFDIANIAYANKEMTFSSQACGAVGSEALQINNNGTKLYVAAKTNDTIYEYNLSTANDVSSASYSSNSLDIQSTTSNVCGVEYFRFNSAGTKLFVGSPNRKFCQYNLTSAFDLSTATFSSSSTLSSAKSATAIELSSDDTKLYLGDYGQKKVFQLAFDITLSSSTPADNATNVSESANIVLNFSESVDAETGNITIKKTSDDSTIETINVTGSKVTGSGSSQITINPATTLDSLTEYYVLIDATAFDDSSSNSYAGISSTTALSFTTGDTSNPTLSSSTPADNATAVAIDANIVLNFSESVDAETGNITIKKTSDDSTVESFSVTGSKVSGSGSSQITVNPTSNFDPNIEYYVLIDATAFDDSSSNSYAGISSTTALSFTSANVLPTLSSSTPADDATDVARDANIILNFSEIVDVETGYITIKKTSDNSTFETIDVTSSNVTGTGTTQITVNPTSNFDADTEYYVLIDATAFDDVSSGSYAGISSTTALSFITESMTDPITDKDVVGSIDIQSQLAKSFITQSTSTVSNRLSYLRQNKDNQNLSRQNIKLDFGNAILTSLTNELLAKNDKSIIPDNWSSWSEGSLSSSKIGDSNNSSSGETDGQALAFGFDTKLKDNDLLGFAIQYGNSDTDVGSSGSKTDSENINFSVYRTRPLDNDNFIEGMFGVGLIESDLTRISGSNTLTGSRNGKQIFGSINYGKTLDKGDFNLTPVVRLDLGYTELDAYSETGTDALSYSKQTIESGLASIGLEFKDIVKFNDDKLKPFGSIEYGMDFSNSSDAKMNYVSDTSTIYTYTQGANSNHLITSVVGFEYITKDNLEIISSYKRIQGNESEQTDILNVSVNFRSKQETEYAMSVDGSEDLKAGFDITKKVNGFDLKFNANQSLSEKSDQRANISLSRSF